MHKYTLNTEFLDLGVQYSIYGGSIFGFLENRFLRPIFEKYKFQFFSNQPFQAEMGFKFIFSKIPPFLVKPKKSSEFDVWYLNRTAWA